MTAVEDRTTLFKKMSGAADTIMKTMTVLIKFFESHLDKKDYDYIKVRWDGATFANKISSGTVSEYISDNVAPILNSFKDDVAEMNMNKILVENDYTKYITDDCVEDTRALILKLIPCIKSVYIEGSKSVQKKMKKIVTILVNYSHEYLRAKTLTL
jgi:hypothetical protein